MRNMYRYLTLALILGMLSHPIFSQTIIKPADTAPTTVNPLVWGEANVRADATVGITGTQPRSGSGSLEFATNTVTSGQDKADFEIYWEDITTIPIDHPTRTLAALSKLQFEIYRSSSSTNAGHFLPVFRLYVVNPSTGHIALLIWENIYNGNVVTEDTWMSRDILSQKFWMFVPSGQGIPSGVVQNFGVTLADWINTSPSGQTGDPTPVAIDASTLVVGINTGVGSGWGNTFLGFVDNIICEFNGSDEVSANFEIDAPAAPHPYVLLATVDIEISAATATEGDMHANDDIELNRGAPTVHTGSLTAGDDIDISSKNTISGDVTAGGDVDNDGTVNGTVTEDDAVSLVDIPPLAPFSAGTEDITVEEDETLDLPPGSYGDVEVERDGILNLSAGEYFLAELILGTDTELNIDLSAGAIVINVVNKLRFGDRSVVNTSEGDGGSVKVTFNSLQSSNLELRRESTVLGTIIAPDAKVRAESYVNFRGAICAEDIAFSTGGTILHHDSQTPLKQVADRDAENAAHLPQQYELAQNYPNPFNPTTNIAFRMADGGFVELAIYDISGRLVKTLVSENRNAGNYTVSWDATNNLGETVSSGIYFYRIQTADFRQMKKMILMK